MKREPGENPGRSGHCMWGAAPSVPLGLLTREGGRTAEIHESGDLPGQVGYRLPCKGRGCFCLLKGFIPLKNPGSWRKKPGFSFISFFQANFLHLPVQVERGFFLGREGFDNLQNKYMLNYIRLKTIHIKNIF